MNQHQFTVNPEGITNITPEGVVVRDSLALPNFEPYQKKPVQVAVHHDLTLQMHGARFNVSAKLTLDEAMGLLNVLAYITREQLAKRG